MTAPEAARDDRVLRCVQSTIGFEGERIEFAGRGRAEWGDEVWRLFAPCTSPSVRLVFAVSLNGAITDLDASSEGLSNRTDRAMLGVLLRRSDAVVVGAQTLRLERHPTRLDSRLAIVSASGDLEGVRLDPAFVADRVSVYCPAAGAERARATLPGAEVVALADASRGVAAAIVGDLRAKGSADVLVEGGAEVARRFLGEGLVDELVLTTAPVLTSPGALTMPGASGPLAWRRAMTLIDGSGLLYSRLTRA